MKMNDAVDNDEAKDNIDRAIDFAIENAADDPAFTADAAVEDDDDNLGEGDATSTTLPAESSDQGDTTNAGANTDTIPSGDANATAQPQPTETQAPDANPNKTLADKDGNFIDENGKIIARAGSERRMYERLTRSERTGQFFESENVRLQKELTDNQALSGLPQKYNLNNDEVGLGLHIINQLKTSPVEAGRWILQEVMKSGYNLQQILGDVEGVPASSMDMGAITRMIDEKLSPITNQFQQQESATKTEADNERSAQQFIATHDYADVHIETIVNLMKQNPQLSSERAYFEVRQYAQANGLDFTQPLGAQIEARRNTTTQPTPANVNSQPNRVMPNGNSASTTETQQPEEVSADDDWDKIINQSMSEAGMQ